MCNKDYLNSEHVDDVVIVVEISILQILLKSIGVHCRPPC